MFSKLAHENRRNRSEKPEPLPLDKQVELAMSRLVFIACAALVYVVVKVIT